jgi:hypothetical protein
MKPRARTKLTEQEQEFCYSVARHGNATKAARDAGFKHPNKHAYKLLERKVVSDEVARLRAIVASRADEATVASALEIREKFTWLMRHAESEDTQLKAGMVLAKLVGMGDEFNHPGSVSLPSVVDTKGYTIMSRAELAAESKAVAFKLLKLSGGNDGNG